MVTVEKLARIMTDIEGGSYGALYGALEAFIVIKVIYEEIATVPIEDESIISETNYNFLISITSAIRLLRDKYSLNEQSIRSLLGLEYAVTYEINPF